MTGRGHRTRPTGSARANDGQDVTADRSEGRRTQRPRRRVPRWLAALNLLYLLLLFGIAVSNAIGPDRWWFGSANLYLPQWVWALPGVFVLAVTATFGRRLTWLPLLCLIYVIGPLMGYCWNRVGPATGRGIHLRVMTYNIKWNHRDATVIADQVRFYHPDLLQIQDGGSALDGPLSHVLSGWNVRISEQYFVASRYPLSDLDSLNISFPGQHHHGTRATLTVDGVPLTVIDVHLLTPRDGLVAVRHHQVETMEVNATSRLIEAQTLARQVREIAGPIIITGDLNSPVQSLACRTFFDIGFKDAFSLAGNGYGYTYGQDTRIRMPFVRIDHILVNAPWQVLDCTVGDSRGSDHSPVVADLFLPAH